MNAAPSPPALLEPIFDTMPAELTSRPQWVAWRAVWQPDKGKYNKIPIDAKTGKNASSTDPATWATFDQARRFYERNPATCSGVGFVLCDDDPFFGVDLDHGTDKAQARKWISDLATYTELSPSGKGVRLFGIGNLPPGDRKRGTVECYESARFLTVTGRRFPDTPSTVNERQEQIEQFHREAFPVKEKPRSAPRSPGDGFTGADTELLSMAFQAANGAKVSALYGGDISGYPGHSEADLALCAALAFWVGPDGHDRLDRLFRGSGLMRDKWDERHYANGDTYGQRTIRKAIDGCSEFYTPQAERTRTARTDRKPTDAGEEDTLFPCTDLGNAERVLRRHGADLRYNAAFGWLVWDGKRWQTDDSGEVYRHAEETIRAIPLEAAELARKAASLPAGDDRREGLNKRAQHVLSWALKSESAPRIKAAVELLQHQPGIYAAPDAFDADPFLLNCENGIIDLRTGELLPHDRDRHCMHLSPVAYKPDAATPLWERCLERWQPDAEVRAFLRRAAGYSLTGHTGEETAFLLYGLGRNGKSKFTGALEMILGDYAGRAPIDLFMETRKGAEGPTPDKANLAGKRLVVASEIQRARRFNESFVKDVTGGDRITAARKFKDPFTFKPQMKLWLYGNHKPIVTGADDGIKARLPLIPFTVTIPAEERDPDLDAKLRAEAEGILAWAVRGCLEWQKLRLAPPAAIVQASEAYHEEMDVLAQFFRDRLIFGRDEDGNEVRTAAADIRAALVEWAQSEGIDERSLPKPGEMAERLRRQGCDNFGNKTLKINGKAQKAWSNVRIRTEEEAPNDPKVTPVTPVTPKTGKYAKRNDMGKDASNGVTGVTGVTSDAEDYPPGYRDEDLDDPFAGDDHE